MIVVNARIAADLLEPVFADSAGEKVAVVHLDSSRRVIALAEEAPGGEAEVELPVRAIIATALRLGAAGMILAHNHPSGDPRPSRADIAATRALAAAAGALGIRIHDHFIFAGRDFRSFRALGLL